MNRNGEETFLTDKSGKFFRKAKAPAAEAAADVSPDRAEAASSSCPPFVPLRRSIYFTKNAFINRLWFLSFRNCLVGY